MMISNVVDIFHMGAGIFSTFITSGSQQLILLKTTLHTSFTVVLRLVKVVLTFFHFIYSARRETGTDFGSKLNSS